jgi:hypothetical protein
LLRPLVPADEAAVLAATTAKHVFDGREAVAEVTPRLRQVVLDSTDVRRSAEFWRQLLGLSYRPGQEPPPPGAGRPGRAGTG